MQFKNTSNEFGLIAKLLHWGVATLFILQFIWVYIKIYALPEKSALGLFLLKLVHKPIGFFLLVISFLTVYWRLTNIKPSFPKSMPEWEKFAAKVVHFCLFFVIVMMPVTGFIASNYGGFPINIFGLFKLPLILPTDKERAKLFLALHEYCSYLSIFLLIVHLGAVVKHQFIDKCNILKRMQF